MILWNFTMQIELDTYQNNKLYYGMNGSDQRTRLLAFRRQEFMNTFLNDYPDIYLKLQTNDLMFLKIIYQMRKLKFNDMSKLAYSMNSSYLEVVNTKEFNSLIKRFKHYLKCGENTKEELKEVMCINFRALPSYW